MDRRAFLKKSSLAASLVSSANVLSTHSPGEAFARESAIPRRKLGKTGAQLSIIGFGGIRVTDTTPEEAASAVADAIRRGINYFDVAPSYGNAEERLGPALAPYRREVFLACKTQKRDRAGASEELERSLKRMQTDHFDLYQLHALTKREELEQALAPNGAMEAIAAAKKEGKVRFIGFSAHSVETALAAMEAFPFDTILFPFNFVLFSQANFGPQVLARARQKKMGILALKAMAKTRWPSGMKQSDRPYPKCWYEPCDFGTPAETALRWTLSLPITAAVPPGDTRFFNLALEVAGRFKPLDGSGKKALLAGAKGVEPLFKLANS